MFQKPYLGKFFTDLFNYIIIYYNDWALSCTSIVLIFNTCDISNSRLPVTNAFCSCALSPVFHGSMVSGLGQERQMKNKAKATTDTKTALKIPMIYFHIFPEGPLVLLLVSLDPPTWFGLVGGSVGDGSGGRVIFFLSFGTAGNDPLLLVLGREIICLEREAPLAGAAARLLDCSASLRRTISYWFRMCGSEEPADVKN